jgi:serine/threonine-protein kinase
VLRSLGKILGVLFALTAIIAGLIATKIAMARDPNRLLVAEAQEGAAQLRHELGRDAHVSVTPIEGAVDDDAMNVKVTYPASTPMGERRELENSTNIVIRRSVHHVHDLKIAYGEEHVAAPPELPAGADGGTAITGPTPIAPTTWAVPSTEPIVQAPPPSTTATPPKKGAAKKGSTGTGTITLVTFPESKVFRGNTSLGKTPLFNVELPVGTHLLTLVGDDGSRHALSVPVHAGKNPPVKVTLGDVPER